MKKKCGGGPENESQSYCQKMGKWIEVPLCPGLSLIIKSLSIQKNTPNILKNSLFFFFLLVILLYLLFMLRKSKYRIRAAKLTSPGCVTGRVRVMVWVEVLREETGSCPLCGSGVERT